MESKLDISKKETLIILLKFLIVFALAILAVVTFFSDLWIRNPFEIHSILELICIFIALSIFVIIFIINRYDRSVNHVLGVGFLTVATFNFFHIISFSPDFFLNEISLEFCFLTRLIENLTLLAGTFRLKYKNNMMFRLLVYGYIPILIISTFIFYCKNPVVPFFDINGCTIYKIVCHVVLMSISLIVIYRILNTTGGDPVVYHKNTLLAICLMFTSETLFSFCSQSISNLSIMGHIMKVLAYCLLFQRFFIESISKTYNQLKSVKFELQEILNGLPLGIINYNKSNQITFANTLILNILKCNLEDLVNLKHCELYKNFSITEDETAYSSEQRKNVIIKTVGNPSLKLQKNSFPYLNGCTETFFDVSGEDILNNLRFQTYSILNSINNHVILLDKEERIVNCNKAAEKFYNTDLKTINGLAVENFKAAYNFICENYPNDDSDEKDFLNATILVNKKVKHIMFHYSKITDFENNLLGHIMVSLDITPSKLNEEKWKQQEKLALIGEMGSGIVHEAKNYLALIRGYCEMLALQVEKTDDMMYVDKILRAANDLNNVVSEFLNLAKPSDLIMDILSVNEIIQSMDYMLTSTNLLKRTKLIVNLSDEDPDILGDETQIKQVILNMIKNASESMEQIPDPTLKIATRLDKTGDNIEIIIEDNGIGISKVNLKKLGTPFFTTKEKGTGLGLTTCYKMIEDHDGSISVKSLEGLGTTFVITLPIFKEETSPINN